jgi:iron complex transport system substrate-binding protein
MNIVSLLPSATEILYALGLGKSVVGVTHECDFPEDVRNKPILTRCVFDSVKLSQHEIDSKVRELATAGESLYAINDELLREVKPDLIVTQDLCHVCAITPREVDRAISNLETKPDVLSLNPKNLEDVFSDMIQVGNRTKIVAQPIVKELQDRIKKIAPASLLSPRPSVACIEWLNPLWRTGHWVPEMVQLAGGEEVFAQIGHPSRPLKWEELAEKDPDILIFMPCGYNLEKTRDEFTKSQTVFPWHKLKSYQNGLIYLTDANSYFSRSGPRLVNGVELLAEILHPEFFQGLAPAGSYVRMS